MKAKIRNLVLSNVAISVLLAASSCYVNVGLGNSVDTAVPVISVDYPPASSVIKGSFVVSGTCTDDLKVEKVYLNVRKSNSSDVIQTVTADISGETWKATLNSKLDLLDGQYSIDAYAMDGADHISPASTASYDIDNTAPCLIISKPLAVGSESPSIFGQTIKIAGDISEAHKTSSLLMHIKQWDSDKNEFVEGSEQDISISDFSSMSKDNPLVIAQYYSEDAIAATTEATTKASMQALRKKYFEIYDIADGENPMTAGNKIFYANIQLTDNAKEYKNPGDNGTGTGNSSDMYYVNSTDFDTELGNANAKNLTATNLRNILNGTDTKYTTSEKEDILEKLKAYSVSSKKEDLSSEKSSHFLVNPVNNPTYSLASEYLLGGDFTKINSGDSVTVNLKAGRDSVEINPADVTITVYKMDNATDRDFSSKANDKKYVIATGSDGKLTSAAIDFKVANTEETGEYTDDFFQTGSFYIVKASGTDIDGSELVEEDDNGYGFQITANTNPPVITINSEQDEYISGDELKNTGKVISLNIKTAGTTTPPVTLTGDAPDTAENHIKIYKSSESTEEKISVTNISTNTSYELPVEMKLDVGTPDSNYNYPVTITLGGNGTSYMPSDSKGNELQGKFKYTFKIQVKDSVDSSSYSIFSFYVNNINPSLQDLSITPVESDNKVNGTVTFGATATTNYEMESVSYKVYVGDSTTPVATGITDSENSNFGTLSYPQASFDTAASADYDGKALKIVITATDKVGNNYSSTIDGYTIDQSTDLPQLVTQNFAGTMEKASVSSTNGNVFDKNSKIIGSFTDTDGLAEATYDIKNESGTSVSSGNLTATSGALFNIPCPTTAGYYQVTLSAKDSTWAAGTTTTKAYRCITDSFWIAVDNSVPSITLKTVDGSSENLSSTLYKNGSSIAFAGTVKDDWDVEKIEVYVNGVKEDTTPEIVTPSPANADGTKNWTYSLDMSSRSEGNYTVKFKVLDKAGKSKEISSTIVKDITKSVFGDSTDSTKSALKITTTDSNGWYKDNSVEITGYVKDATSPVSSVEYSLNDTDWKTLNISYTSVSGVEDKKQVKYSGTVLGIKNGDYVIVRATDAAGNTQKTATTAGLQIDMVSPEIALTQYDVTIDSTATYKDYSGNIIVNNQKTLYLKGTVTDTAKNDSGASGVASVYFKFKSTPTAAASGYDFKGTVSDGTWTASVPAATLKTIFGSSSTSGTLYVLEIDKAGNETSVPLSTVIYDVTYPAASISKIKYYGTDNAISSANKKITFEGTASDNQSVSSVKLQYSADNKTWKDYSATNSGSDVNNWAFVVNTEDSVFTDGKTYYFRVAATDSAGNTGNSGTTTAFDTAKVKTVAIDQSSDVSKVNFTNVTFIDGMSSTNTSWLKKTNDVYLTATDDDGVKSFQYSTDGTNYSDVTNGKITLGDSSYTLYFKVTDTQGTVFTSNTSLSPVLKDDADAEASTKGILYLSIDKTPPVVGTRTYYLYDGSAYPSTGVTSPTSLKFGGDKNKLKIVFEASDSNGISGVKVTQGTQVWTGTCADTSYNDADSHTWTVEIKDSDTSTYLADLDSGTYEFTLAVTDKSGSDTQKSFSLNIDNTPAVLSVDSHSTNELVGTAFILKGVVTDSDISTRIKFLINGSSTAITDWNNTALTEYSGTIASWRINVDGATAAEETHTKELKDLFLDIYGTSLGLSLNEENKIVTTSTGELYTTVQPMYFHFLTKDGVGNLSTTTFVLRADPQGDLPTVKITYPTASDTETNSVTLSGSIRTQGEADTVGDNTVMGIYMQIDPSYSSSFNESIWKKTSSNDPVTSVVSPSLKDDDGNAYKLSDIYKSGGVTLFENVYKRYNAQSGIASSKKKTETTTENNEYGIYVGNKTTWNLTLNRYGELNGIDGAQNTVAIRLIIVDSAGNLTKSNPLIIKVDSDAPIFGSEEFYVYQWGWKENSTGTVYYTNTANPDAGATLYTDSGCRTDSGKTYSSGSYTADTASEIYTDDMSLKGEWWLSGSVEDESDIYQVVESDSGKIIVTKDNSDSTGTYTAETGTAPSSTVERYTSSAGNNGFIVNLRVGSANADEFGQLTYTLKASEYNEEESKRKYSEKLISINYDNKAPEVDTSGDYFNISSSVVNSYGFYKLGTAAYENGSGTYTQSGFARAVFYFEKSGSIYDSYIKKNGTGNAVTSTSLTSMDGLYWKVLTASAISGATITVSSTDSNIHKGGLVKLGGVYYTITDKSGTDITLDKNPSASLAGSSIYFAIGNVVDNEENESDGTLFETTSEEGYGYYTNADTTDDFMVESVSKGVSRTIWSGNVNSSNIPDGPAVLHYVVFDKAGNYTPETLDVLVGNNAPRLASVRVWCDFNDNGTEDTTDETKYYYYAERNRKISGVTGKKASDVTSRLTAGSAANPFMTVKDSVNFIPEIVGGNGALYYSYNIDGGTETKVTTSFGTGHDDGNLFEAATGTYLLSDDNGETYIAGHSGYGTDDGTEYKFTIAGSSLSSYSGATPFNFTIWDSADGSTLWNSSKCLNATMTMYLNVKYNDTTAPMANVKPLYWTSKTDNSLYQNSSDKGHIELVSYLSDDLKTSAYGTATYPKVSGIITIRGTSFDDIRLHSLKIQFPGHSAINTATVAATYSKGVWTSVSADTDANMAANGWTFTAKDRYNNESGHLVDWECNIDTSFITGVAALGKTFAFTSVDGRTSDVHSSSSTAATSVEETVVDTYNRPSLSMDVVPYIRRIQTSLSSVDSTNPSVYDRTALGHYATYIGETTQLVGFNLAKGNANVTYTVPDATSGLYSRTVNSITTINNINNNDAPYNSLANGVNNDLLTDDVYIDRWTINNRAVVPSNNQVLNMEMGINQSSQKIGFAFNNGTYDWSMPTSDYSYAMYSRTASGQQDFTRCSSFTYDKNGNSYGAALWGNEGDPYDFYSSRWGTNSYMSIGSNIATNSTQDKERYQGASYASTVNTSSTNLYMAVFDQVYNYIEFKYGVISGSKADNGLFNSTTASESTDNSLILANADGLTSTVSSTLGKASQYIGLGVTSDNTVVMVWYDGTKLMYAYNKFTYTTTTRRGNTTETLTPGTWHTVSTLMPSGGKFCKVAIDSSDGVHIAAYDTANQNLNYIYINKAAADASDAIIKTAVVDSYNNVGQELTIDVAKSGDYQIPYIAYWGTYPKRPHYAYLADPESFYGSTSGLNGATSDKYTGIWECTIVPSSSTIFIDESSPQKMCVGVWKTSMNVNGAGTLTTSSSTTSSSNSTNGNVYGNGTSNAVIGYLVTNTSNASGNYGETAQLK